MPKMRKSYYYLDRFAHYLGRNFNMSLKDYCKQYLGIIWPLCPYSGVETNYKVSGKGVVISSKIVGYMNQENSPKFKAACEAMSIARKGKNNPMYGKTAWNKGLNRDNNESVRQVSESLRGRVATEITREKQREARRLNPKKARHTTPHTEETKKLLREHTAKMWSTGRYSKKTSIEQKVEDFLTLLGLNFIAQFNFGFYSLDIAIPQVRLAIECQGTYYHADPRVYPKNGKALTLMQQRNLFRDSRKKDYISKQGWALCELWEIDINDGTFKDILLCKLREYSGLLKLENLGL